MSSVSAATETIRHRRLQPASSGFGPLIQRDYWAVIDSCRFSPGELVSLVAHRFSEFPPSDVVVFTRKPDASGALTVGEEIDIRIRMSGNCGVRVIHRDDCSFTFATLEGHPEAGRITFGAYRNDMGDVIFHIRSRVRSSTRMFYWGFRSAGDPMQTQTWTDFVNSVALTCGSGVIGCVHADTWKGTAGDVDDDDEAMEGPTYLARDDT